MARGSNNLSVWVESSNRAPFYSDGVVDSTLLTAGSHKPITPKGTAGNPAIASSVVIVNASGYACTVSILAVLGFSGVDSNGNPNPVTDTPTSPIYLASGDTQTVNVRCSSVVETNVGGSTQTGRGVRYTFTLEPA